MVFPSVCTKAIFIIFCQGKSPCHTNSIWMAFVKMFWKLFCNMEDCTASTCTEPGMNSPNMNFQFMQWVEPFVVLKTIKGFCPCNAPFVNFHILTRKASEIENITMSLQLGWHIHFSSVCGMAPLFNWDDNDCIKMFFSLVGFTCEAEGDQVF